MLRILAAQLIGVVAGPFGPAIADVDEATIRIEQGGHDGDLFKELPFINEHDFLIVEEEDVFFDFNKKRIETEWEVRQIERLKEIPFYELDKFEPFHAKCLICITKHQDFYQLSCDDSFCANCASLLLQNYIESSFVFPGSYWSMFQNR